MKYVLFVLYVMCVPIVYSQDIIVEKVLFGDTNNLSEIPRIKDLKNPNNAIVKKINMAILDRFMIKNFEPNKYNHDSEEENKFYWHNVYFNSEIKNNILYIGFTGEYCAFYPNFIRDELYFNLKTGERLAIQFIPFQSLFTLSGYLDFINNYWLKGVKKSFQEAIQCAGIIPYCSYYDIYDYEVNNHQLFISLVFDCYPHVVQACSPEYGISIDIDSISCYLNNLGKHILISSDYLSKKLLTNLLQLLHWSKILLTTYFFLVK